jgi:hypothetical protein
VICADKTFTFSGGRLFALYVAGRLAVETMRVDHGGDRVCRPEPRYGADRHDIGGGPAVAAEFSVGPVEYASSSAGGRRTDPQGSAPAGLVAVGTMRAERAYYESLTDSRQVARRRFAGPIVGRCDAGARDWRCGFMVTR